MITIQFTARFIKRLRELPLEEVEVIEEKIEKFKDEKNHKALKVHKLHGRMKGNYAFSATYQKRVIFFYMKKNIAIFLSIITHDEYT